MSAAFRVAFNDTITSLQKNNAKNAYTIRGVAISSGKTDAIGHSFVQILDNNGEEIISRGFWPKNGVSFFNPDLYNSVGVEGEIHDDYLYEDVARAKGATIVSFTYEISSLQLSSAMNVINKWEQNTPRYRVIPRCFCSTFTQEVINSTGNYFPSGTPNQVIRMWNSLNGVRSRKISTVEAFSNGY